MSAWIKMLRAGWVICHHWNRAELGIRDFADVISYGILMDILSWDLAARFDLNVALPRPKEKKSEVMTGINIEVCSTEAQRVIVLSCNKAIKDWYVAYFLSKLVLPSLLMAVVMIVVVVGYNPGLVTTGLMLVLLVGRVCSQDITSLVSHAVCGVSAQTYRVAIRRILSDAETQLKNAGLSLSPRDWNTLFQNALESSTRQ